MMRFGLAIIGVISCTNGLSAPKNILYDTPVSNNGARCRIVAYKKKLPPSELTITNPSELGGTKSEEYLSINPQGKVPSLRCTRSGVCIAESDTVTRYLISEYRDTEPSFEPDNPISNMMARFHDVYLSPLQTCLYKPGPPFGTYGSRRDALVEYSKQLGIIADLMDDDDGMYLCGKEVSIADATLFPSMVFASHFYPKFDSGLERPIPQKLEDWFERLLRNDLAFKRVYDEMMAPIEKWNENGRWDNIWLAGSRDVDPQTVFDKIVSGEIPASIVKEDDKILAFKDINPAAPAHVLVIPKYRDGLTRLSKATGDQAEILGLLLLAAGEIARDESLGFGVENGARIVINDGKGAGQEVFHLHLHVLAGREFGWPPG